MYTVGYFFRGHSVYMVALGQTVCMSSGSGDPKLAALPRGSGSVAGP